MLITGFAIATGTAAKWILAAKIMTMVGTGCITAAPVLRKIQKNLKMKKEERK